MSDEPLVSTIVPVYNRDHCVMDAVQSVLGQSYPNVECIVVDDGSSDDSYAVVAAAAAGEPRLRVFTQPNLGVSAARNHALREVQGEYVTFLDSDDLMPPHRIHRQLELLTECGCDAVMGRSEVHAIDGAALPSWLDLNGWYFTSVFLATHHVRAVGGFDESLRLGEDLDLLVRLRGAGVELFMAEETFTVQRYFGDNLCYGIDGSESYMPGAIRRHLARRRAAPAE